MTPKVGAIVKTAEGRGTVVDVNLLTGVLTVRLDANPDAAPQTFKRDDVSLIKDSQIRVDRKEMAELSGLEDK